MAEVTQGRAEFFGSLVHFLRIAFPGQRKIEALDLPGREYVQMQVWHLDARDEQPGARGIPHLANRLADLLRDAGALLEQVRLDVLPLVYFPARHHESMTRCHRGNSQKCDDILVLPDETAGDLPGNDLAEDGSHGKSIAHLRAIRHYCARFCSRCSPNAEPCTARYKGDDVGCRTVRVLVIGSGAREHALLLALRRDPAVTGLMCAPGNAGTAEIADQRDVDAASADDVVALVRELSPDLVVIGPEVPLVLGVADAVRKIGVPCFGPSAAAAQIEGSKAFAKDVMAKAGVRTAHAEVVDNPANLDAALDRFGPTWVVKDDRLAGGKGVVVSADRAVARDHAAELLEKGHPVLLESFLDGPEVSLFCLVDGEDVVPLLPAQDHKRAGDDDSGPNTGGMGAYTPLPWLPDGMVTHIVDDVVRPVAREMAERGCPFSGLLYAGLAIGSDGPAVVEFNCRFGDPETQVVLEMLDTPLAGLLMATANGTLGEVGPLQWKDGYAVTVVIAAENYPGKPRTGDVITGADIEGVLHAGTARRADGALLSAGGRVLSVIGYGADLATARDDAYEKVAHISLPGGHYRTDIGRAAAEGRISIPS